MKKKAVWQRLCATLTNLKENDTPPLRAAYTLMRARHGHLRWWPAETAFEVCVGAILVQNTNWINAERAIQQLKARELLALRKLYALPEAELAQGIRPSGSYQIKAKRLRNFLHVLVDTFEADLAKLFAGDTSVVRQRLLDIHGIGPETADCMLLYAGGHASFVIDAYTRRIFQRHGWCPDKISYDDLKDLCERHLETNNPAEQIDYWQDYHAQLVQVGKTYCRSQMPKCVECPLKTLLPRTG